MSASINISSRGRRASARRTRLVGQGGFTGGVKRRRVAPRIRTFALPRQIVVRRSTAEKKFFDTSLATATTAAWAIIQASGFIPGQGQTVETRIGDKVSVTSINFRMYLSMNALEAQAAPSPVILTRIIVGISHQDVIGAASDVVDTGSTSQLMSYYTNTTIGDFTILKDFMIKVFPHALNEGTANAFAHGVSISDVIKFTHTFKKPMVVKFAAGSTTVKKNALFILAVSTATGAVQNIETRIRYTDS